MKMSLRKYSSCKHPQVLMQILVRYSSSMLEKNCTTRAPVQEKLQLPNQGPGVIPPNAVSPGQ